MILLTEAARVAAEAHAGQTRKGTRGAPYVNHAIAVARMVAEHCDDPEVVAAALLHDVVEDTSVTAADIRRDFGARVAALVDEVTDAPALGALPMPERKAAQAAHMRDASPGAKIIKIADQTSNLEDLAREPECQSPERHAAYRAGAVRVVEACRDAAPTLAERFDRAVEAHRAAIGETAGA